MSEGDEAVKMRRDVKDSVFCDLFSRPEYVLELYRALHPEDLDAREDDVSIVTIRRVITTGQYNDLGFTVGDRLLVLVEAQSTWSPNVALRALAYAAETIRTWALNRKLNLYGATPVAVPRPELYVIYTGGRRSVPERLRLSEALGWGPDAGIEATVTVLRGSEARGVIGQYVDLTDTFDAYRVAMGATEEAVRGAVRDCISRGVLAEYLRERESEVISMMVTLYDSEEIEREWREAVTHEAQLEGMAKGMLEGMTKGMAEGMTKGMAAGMTKGESRLGRLVSALMAAGRTDDVARAASDESARSALYAELGIA